MLKKIKINNTNNVNFQKLSRIFLPFQIIPKESANKQRNTEIHSKSSKLMLELGIIKQSSPGCYNLLPFGLKALEKLTKIVDDTMQSINGQKVEFPTLIKGKLWETSGRINEITELFKLKDRHDQSYILGPTHEEIASELLSNSQYSYKQFPLLLYQISNKFRDELKPKFGLIRSKQFLMKDLYSFDTDEKNAMKTYEIVSEGYNKLFNYLGIEFSKVEGNTGEMGGYLSHEYHYCCDIGENVLLNCESCKYSFNAELVQKNQCPKCSNENMKRSRGIEVGHTFLLGDRYTELFNSKYINKNGKNTNLQMGCYGLGLTRILGASVESLSTEHEIRWPRSLAPYKVLIIPPKAGSKEETFASGFTEQLYTTLDAIEIFKNDIVIDDRTDLTIGRRYLQGKQMGYPFIIILGNKIKENPVLFELHDIYGKKQLEMNFNDLVTYMDENFKL